MLTEARLQEIDQRLWAGGYRDHAAEAIRELLAEVRRLRGRLRILPPREPYIPPAPGPPRTCEFEGDEP